MKNEIRPIGTLESTAICWGVGAFVGLGALAMLWGIGGWSPMQAIFGGFVVFLVLGFVLMATLGRPSSARSDAQKTASKRPAGAIPEPRPAADPHRPAPSPHREGIAHSMISDTAGPDLNDPAVNRAHPNAAPAADMQVPASSPAPAAAAPERAPAPADDEAPLEGSPPPIGAAVAPAALVEEAVADTPEPEPEAAPDTGPEIGTEPKRLDGPRGGEADDLKKIKGVGPKLESLLNSMGFWHFDQIANWTAAEVAWVDANLDGFKGRVSRDEWVDQARLLAGGGETDFSQKVDKGGVY